VTVTIDPQVFARLCRERGLTGQDIKVSPTTRARIRKGLTIRESTARRVAAALAEAQPVPLLAELLAAKQVA
jgi:hypothetical protein